MKIKNFSGFVAVKNFASFPAEFTWNSIPYVFEAGEEANLPRELAIAAIKGTVYKITENGYSYSYILPLDATPEEEIPVKTGDLVLDSVLQFRNMHEMQVVKLGITERVKHQTIPPSFSLTADGKGDAHV